MRRIAIIAGALVLAALAAMQAVGTAGARLNPQLALSVMPFNGEAHAQLSMLELQKAVLSGAGKPPAGTSPSYQREALKAFAEEPTSAQAIRQLALAQDFGGNKAEAGKLMALGARLSKRDDGINMWLIDHYLQRGVLGSALRHYDMILRTSSVAAPFLIPKLAQSVQQPAIIAPLAALLATRPPWAREFWFSTIATPASLVNAARLRLAVADRAVPTDDDLDARLIGALTKSGNFAEAEAVYRRLGPPRRQDGALLSSADFATPPKLPPFDWAFSQNGLQTGSIAPEARALVLSGASGNSGVAAYRYLALAPGNYALALDTDMAGKDSQPRVTAAITCAQNAEARPLAQIADVGGKIAGTFTVGAECRYYRLDLVLAVPRNSEADDITITRLTLRQS